MPTRLSKLEVRTVRIEDAADIFAVDPFLELRVSGINLHEIAAEALPQDWTAWSK